MEQLHPCPNSRLIVENYGLIKNCLIKNYGDHNNYSPLTLRYLAPLGTSDCSRQATNKNGQLTLSGCDQESICEKRLAAKLSLGVLLNWVSKQVANCSALAVGLNKIRIWEKQLAISNDSRHGVNQQCAVVKFACFLAEKIVNYFYFNELAQRSAQNLVAVEHKQFISEAQSKSFACPATTYLHH